MRKGVQAEGNELFDLLRVDDAFCTALGRTVLAGSRLETRLREYLIRNGAEGVKVRDTLGRFLDHAERTSLLLSWVPTLRVLVTQRNYLVHSVHPLFAGAIEETILPRSNLLDSDIEGFTDRARELIEDLNSLARVLEKQQSVPYTSLECARER